MLKKIKNVDGIEKSSFINMAIKPISIILSMLYTPLLLSYLGDEKYGLWATVLSIISWINYFDAGIGNGLRNILSSFIAKKQLKQAQKAVSTAYIALTAISSSIFVILIIVVYKVNWYVVFSTQVDMRMTLFISFLFICINFVLALGNILLYSLQLSEKVAIRNVIAQGLNIVGLFLLNRFSRENIVYIAILFGITQMVVNIGNSIQVMSERKYLIPKISKFEKRYLSSICNVGIKFFIIQIMCLAMFTVDSLLITHFWGPATNTPFSIANKIFNTGYSIFAAFTVPYWSGTTAAIEENNSRWIKQSIKKVVKVFWVFLCGYFGVMVIFKPVVNLWLGKALNYQYGLILVMAIFYTLYSILNIECQFINGSGKINVQMYVYIVAGVLNIPFSIFLGAKCGLSALGIRLATLILVAVMDIIFGINLHYIIKKIGKNDTDS